MFCKLNEKFQEQRCFNDFFLNKTSYNNSFSFRFSFIVYSFRSLQWILTHTSYANLFALRVNELLSPQLSHCLRGQIFVLELFSCKRGYLMKSGCENLYFIYKATVIDKEKENWK